MLIPSRNNIGFYFKAMAGHVDGAGSNIVFDIYSRIDGKYVLNVGAYLINDFPLGNDFYVNSASLTWALFATNIRNNTGATL